MSSLASTLARPKIATPLRRAGQKVAVTVVPCVRRERRFLLLLAFGLLLRLLLSALGWPATDSDESTMGLMARHIIYGSEHPVFFYGHAYMGALEAYAAAGAFTLFGASVFTLRLGTILMST